ncbi:MAG: chemotaxis protein methyltransferase [bacterium]|nr:MAG: chemotaxis protein methyltransferase [bacterium]
MELADVEYKRLCDLIHKESGINLQEGKKEMMIARLASTFRSRDITSYGDYYDLVVNDESGNELSYLLNAISTNKTYFFREEKHFAYLNETLLPEIISYKKKNDSLSLWSAGCSSGEEAYSIAMTLKEYHPALRPINPRILATDISTKVLRKARTAIYPKKECSNIPHSLMTKYFQLGVGKWRDHLRVKSDLQDVIEFERFNLLNNPSKLGLFDIIFCRNVLIYFNPKVQEEIITGFYNQLKPKGYLIIGHSESLFNINHLFKYIKPTIFRKE